MIDTRYLYLLISFKLLALFFNTRFLGESGCKNTTIFQTDKIFFFIFSLKHKNEL